MPAAARRLITASLCLIAGGTAVAAQTPPAVAAYVPPTPDAAHVFVLDSAHILSAATIRALQDSSRALQTETGADVAWVTLPTLGGRPVEEAALYIGRTWRIGTPGNPGDPMRNRGLVVLYVPDKTKTAGPNFRIEVGKGLEGTITDSRSRSITTAMRDGLRAKTYDEAYMAGWTAAAALVREDFAGRMVVAVPPAPGSARASTSKKPTPVLGIVLFLLLVVAAVVAVVFALVRRRRATPTMRFGRRDDDDEDRRRRGVWIAPTSDSSWSSTSSSSDDSSSSSSGGDFGGGGGFDGGGSSDSI